MLRRPQPLWPDACYVEPITRAMTKLSPATSRRRWADISSDSELSDFDWKEISPQAPKQTLTYAWQDNGEVKLDTPWADSESSAASTGPDKTCQELAFRYGLGLRGFP